MKRKSTVVELVVKMLTALGFTVEVEANELPSGAVATWIEADIPCENACRYITVRLWNDDIDMAYGKYTVTSTKTCDWLDIVDVDLKDNELTIENLYSGAEAIAHA